MGSEMCIRDSFTSTEKLSQLTLLGPFYPNKSGLIKTSADNSIKLWDLVSGPKETTPLMLNFISDFLDKVLACYYKIEKVAYVQFFNSSQVGLH